ncbi:MAG: DUF3147 family protein [Acidobacteriota bacterium]
MIQIRLSGLRATRPHQYLARFVFGGAATLLAGLIAQHFGPAVGGLFLAFPAIFPASVTLIESHEKERKRAIGRDGTARGRVAAGIDAAGTALGCLGLAGFALVLWRLLPHRNSWLVIALATLAWVAISVALWELRRKHPFRRHSHRAATHPPRAHSAR